MLFSFIPFISVVVSVLELVLPRRTEARVVSWLVSSLQLPSDLDQSIQRAVADVSAAASLAGLVSLVILLWAASGMMAAVRSAFRALWRADASRPFLRGKLLDAALVLGAGVLVVTAFGLTVVAQSLTRIGDEIVEGLGLGDPGAFFSEVTQLAVSAFLTFTAFVVLYRTVPPARVRLVDATVGALVGTVGVLVATAGFSFYLDHFAGFDDIFGPLGAILVFIYLVYVLAAILLFGAGITEAWPHTREPAPPGPRTSVRSVLLGVLRGLVFPRQSDASGERRPG